MLRTSRTPTKKTGIESSDWKQLAAQNCLAADLLPSRPATLSFFSVADFHAIPGIRRFEEPHRAATPLRNSLLVPKLFRWANFFIPRGKRVRILYDSKHAARVTFGVTHGQRNIALAQKCNELVLRTKGRLHISVPSRFRPCGRCREQMR